MHARRGDRIACIGMCTFSLLATTHGRLLERREWALNEKGLAARANLDGAAELLRPKDEDLPGLVSELAALLLA